MSLDKSATNFFELISKLMGSREGGIALMVTLGHVRLHGLAPVPLISPCCFLEFPLGTLTPPSLLRCSSASGSSGRSLAFFIRLQLIVSSFFAGSQF
jgi:hypothetical protein